MGHTCLSDPSKVGYAYLPDPRRLEFVPVKSKVRGLGGYLALAKSMFVRLTLLGSAKSKVSLACFPNSSNVGLTCFPDLNKYGSSTFARLKAFGVG